MKFEVNKFLALTALLAGATAVAAGCSSTDANKTPGGSSGEAGESPTPEAGTGNTPSDGGAAGATVAEGGAAGATVAEGGAGEAGAAGTPGVACIADLIGAGGAADETSPCDLLGAAGAPDCSGEGVNYVAQGCSILYGSGVYRPSVVLAYNDCATKLADSCDADGVSACASALVGQGCTQEPSAAACDFVASKCPGVTASLCAGIMDLATPQGQDVITGCMDPANEFYYEPYTVAPDLDCDANLQYCAYLPVPALP